jgi:hypothetical protein
VHPENFNVTVLENGHPIGEYYDLTMEEYQQLLREKKL